MKLFHVSGYLYTENAIKYLLENGFAWRNDNGVVEVYTEPQWLEDTSMSNGDWFTLHTETRWAADSQSLRSQINHLLWVDPPLIYPAADHEIMKAVGAPTLPGLEIEVSWETLEVQNG